MAAASPKPLFLFGTLRYRPLLEVIIGSDHYRLVDCEFVDHAVQPASGEAHPILMTQPGARALGALCYNLTTAQRQALDFYEALFDYRIEDVDVVADTGSAAACVYRPAGPELASSETWSLNEWVEMWGETTVHAAREVMELRDKISSDELKKRFSTIRARAWSAYLGQRSSQQSGRMLGPLIRTNRHLGFYRLDEYRFRHETVRGTLSDEITREVFVGFDAALVLP
ncbi:gamma-glutamylcyclotransferase [Aestuariibius insulae]|uniref:gamma-glutamylcyclotransferase n=1 Tax=Aestuariibius insulae TaxID=2058287 RepID=UPI00345EB9BA